jgi:hypothetical protein
MEQDIPNLMAVEKYCIIIQQEIIPRQSGFAFCKLHSLVMGLRTSGRNYVQILYGRWLLLPHSIAFTFCVHISTQEMSSGEKFLALAVMKCGKVTLGTP